MYFVFLMFPFSEQTTIWLILAAIVGGVSLYSAQAARMRRLVAVTAILIAFAYLLPTVFLWSSAYGRHFQSPYEILMIAIYDPLGVGAVLTGAIWGWISRQMTRGIFLLAAAVLPSLAAAGYVLERQRVPDAACARQALFEIGDLTIAMPREEWSRSTFASGVLDQAWYGDYADGPNAKPDVRAFCRASDRGHERVRLYHLWISTSLPSAHRRANCESGIVQSELQAYCIAATRTKLNVVQLYARSDGLAKPSSGQFNQAAMDRVLSSGQQSGVRCNKNTANPRHERYCTIWFQLRPEVLAVSSARVGTPTDGEDSVADASVVLNQLISTLRTD